MLMTKLTDIEQQIKMERRMRRKTQKFYKNMKETCKGNEKAGKGNILVELGFIRKKSIHLLFVL